MQEVKLNFAQICSITSGAVQIKQEEDGFHFFRFTKEQMELEHPYVPHLKRTFRATTGIKLSFRTNSRILRLSADMTIGSGRSYYALDVEVDGTLVGGIDNFSHLNLPDDYTEMALERGVHTIAFQLDEGEKDVYIYLPWGACTVLKELALEEGSSLLPIVPSKKMLVFGDSITQGYDVLRPSCHHINRLGRELDAAIYNKALCGAVSFPELTALRESFSPDYILVAYGTNDWRKITLADFLARYGALLETIRDNYSEAQVFLVTPIWRKDSDETWEAGPFADVEEHIRAVAAEFPTFQVISGADFVPKEENFFADLRLHPNDAGSNKYFECLWSCVRKLVKTSLFE